ncbi:MAG: 3-hydroxyisobutyrate dehydrogenase, partial [Rhizobiaceae bacterium]|nr:3-hydroxyisobutyrate dehydrogenase [Rhizobiaceae bacterium]
VEAVVAAASLADAVTDAEAILTMLPNGAIVRAVHAEIVALARPGALLIDCSTIDVESARAVHDLAMDADLIALDAPVSGGTGGAAAGTLTFMVGGAEGAFELGRPLFEVMGSKAVHCGSAGAGQAAKICNNMILGISMVAVCEGFHLADSLGLSRQAMFDVASTSSGSCWALNTYCPAPGIGPKTPADNGYRPGFATELMLKDLTLAAEAAKASGANAALGEHARAIFEAFDAAGGRGRDFSALLEQMGTR